jgi:hypothetical protein
MGDWQLIETAPKDRRILAYGKVALEIEFGSATVKWNSTYSVWHCDPNEASEYDPESCKLTHWMPLPEPPK